MKTGLIMEGGAMRGMYTAGVTDVMMEHKIKIDGAIGVSAGAVFGCNYKSNQPGRVIRYNTKYCRDPRYASFRSLLKTGNLYGEQFCYHELPEKLDPFDAETFQNSPMEFYVTCTDVNTGKAVYHKCKTGNGSDLQWMRASASMPIVSRIVQIDGYSLLDGGIADSIPIRYFESIGYTHNIVILTQPAGFVKQKNSMLPVIRAALRKYPNTVQAVADRHIRYNETLAYIQSREQSGDLLIIRPSRALEVGAREKDPEKLRTAYALGRSDAEKRIREIAAFCR
ncbi:MAG: patatin family protein [Candidatus Limivivens sp.]|nr:patatin family protein [Candidatus Limivivens sp.]